MMVIEGNIEDTMEQTDLFGISFSNVTFEELCRYLIVRIEAGVPGFGVTPNVDHVCMLEQHPVFREAYSRASFVLTDSKPLMWAARLLGRPLRQKLSGSDLVPWLTAFAAEKGYSVFFFGGKPGVPEQAAAVLQEQYPALKVAGVYSPPFGFDTDDAENRKAVEILRAAAPDICFVALGSPRQELWMDACHRQSHATFMIGIGASLDFVAGQVRRAPLVFQTCGLEWFWRILMEPRRLWRRYLVDDMRFFPILWREYRQHTRNKAAHLNAK